MAFFRAIFYYLFIAVGLFVVGIPFMFYKGVLCRRWADSTRVCIPFFNVLFKLSGIKVEIVGKENIPDHKKFVLIANHQSFLDINVIWPSITMTSFIAKAELWKIPVFGWVLTKIGCIPVHRNPRKNLGMGATVKKRLEDNVTISVFPEGHRSNDGHMLPFQNGIFRMAKENEFPLLPVTIVDSGKRLAKTKWSQTPGVVKIVVHPLQTPESFRDKSVAQLRDEMHNMISSALPYRQNAQQEA